MNTHSALSNLVPDSGTTSNVGKRFNAIRAVAASSGSTSPSSPFDALLRQAEAQAHAPSDSVPVALKGGNHGADHKEVSLRDEEVHSDDAERRPPEDMTTPPSPDAWIPQGWSPRDDLTYAFADSALDRPASSTIDGDSTASPKEPIALRASAADGGSFAAASVNARGVGKEPLSPMNPIRSSTRFMETSTPVGSTPAKAPPLEAREPDSARARALGTTRMEGSPDGAPNAPYARLPDGLSLDDDTPDEEATLSGSAETSSATAHRFNESMTEPLPSAGFEPAVPSKQVVTSGRQSPTGSASADADGIPTSRATAPSLVATRTPTASAVPRANAAVESKKVRAGDALSAEPGSIEVVQEGLTSAEEQRSGLQRVTAAISSSVAAQLAPLLPSPHITQPTALPSPAGSQNFTQVMEHARTAPDGYTAARVDTPLTHEAFPRVLGLQIGRWTDEGVQQVWLDVHPADMGPVAIQIELEGRQAELNFGAESAAARQVIEASLPELASALQAAGLTLSGGSISQDMPQFRPRQEGATESDVRRGTPSGKAETDPQTVAPAPARAARVRGLVDLYA